MEDPEVTKQKQLATLNELANEGFRLQVELKTVQDGIRSLRTRYQAVPVEPAAPAEPEPAK